MVVYVEALAHEKIPRKRESKSCLSESEEFKQKCKSSAVHFALQKCLELSFSSCLTLYELYMCLTWN